MREKQRQKAIQKAAAERAAAPAPATPRAGKTLRKGKMAAAAAAADVRLPAAKRRMLETRQDVHDLADEYALLRKLKKGKLSEVRAVSCRVKTQEYDVHELAVIFELSCYPKNCKLSEVRASNFRATHVCNSYIRTGMTGDYILPRPMMNGEFRALHHKVKLSHCRTHAVYSSI